MEIKYDAIKEANNGLVFTKIHGKGYAEVPQRVQAFRKVIPGGFIVTDIVSLADGVVVMRSEAGYYTEDGKKIVLGTGYAYEKETFSKINNTSYIENCETSAVGRALGFIGLGSETSIGSAEEVKHAIEVQAAMESGQIPTPAEVTTGDSIIENPVLTYLAKERETLRVMRQIEGAENVRIWNAQVKVLKENGVVPDKKLSSYSMDEAAKLIDAMYKRFDVKGTELKSDVGKSA
jgi:hypothetical protein